MALTLDDIQRSVLDEKETPGSGMTDAEAREALERLVGPMMAQEGMGASDIRNEAENLLAHISGDTVIPGITPGMSFDTQGDIERNIATTMATPQITPSPNNFASFFPPGANEITATTPTSRTYDEPVRPAGSIPTLQELMGQWGRGEIASWDYYQYMVWNFEDEGSSIQEAHRRATEAFQLMRINPKQGYGVTINEGTPNERIDHSKRWRDRQEEIDRQAGEEQYGDPANVFGADRGPWGDTYGTPRTTTATAFPTATAEAYPTDSLSGLKIREEDIRPRDVALSAKERFTGWVEPIIAGMGPISGLYKEYMRDRFSPMKTQFDQLRSLGRFPRYEAGDPREITTSPFEQFLPTARRLSTEEKKDLLRRAVENVPPTGQVEPSYMRTIQDRMAEQLGSYDDFTVAWDAVKDSIPREFAGAAYNKAFRDYQGWKSVNPGRSFLSDFTKTWSFSPTVAPPQYTTAFNGFHSE